jgi:hypothetical protein
MAALPNTRREEDAPAKSSLPSAVLIVFFAALMAGLAGSLATGLLSWVAICAVAFGGAYFASRTSSPAKKGDDLLRVRRLLLMLDRPGAADSKVPPEFTDEWATLFERMNRIAFESRSNSTALTEMARVRKQIDLAASLMRDGKDPLTEAPELRVGPLQSLLEGMKGDDARPFVSHMKLGEEELIGPGGDPLPSDWPRPTGDPAPPIAGNNAALESGLKAMVRDLEDLRTTLAATPNGENPASSDDVALRTPAQLVDSVVLTAADGIEDLAAGLMRANELASVAERVTNRATLLALNAALEATRSGSEAFAAIAEETRRLAEFAREATDTISRLSSEIEYKVGETITAIHAASENAKTSLAELSGSAVPVPSSARTARVQIVRLLDRSRELLNSLGTPAAPGPDVTMSGSRKPAAAESAAGPNSMQDIVENGPPPADRLPVEGILLIEGLKPGAHFES